MIRILWLAPNFNHYKARFLNHLANDQEIELHILSGSGRSKMGDQEIDGDWLFEYDRLDVPKSKFGLSKEVRSFLKMNSQKFDWIMIPAEKKNLVLFMFLIQHCKSLPNTKLFSYNHPVLKTKNKNLKIFDSWLTKFFFKKLDKVVFYTKESMKIAIGSNSVNSKKAYWVNNTIDTLEVSKYYKYVNPPATTKTILFIGRLIKSKQILILFTYFNELKRHVDNLKLEVIGDGPMAFEVERAMKQDQDIIWHKSLVDEQKIAPIMTRSSLVYVPGHSGLSINHAFVYGRPYVTLESDKHGPEISYLINSQNGFILGDNFQTNIDKLTGLLQDSEKLNYFCQNAYATGKEVSVEKWVAQMKNNLLDE